MHLFSQPFLLRVLFAFLKRQSLTGVPHARSFRPGGYLEAAGEHRGPALFVNSPTWGSASGRPLTAGPARVRRFVTAKRRFVPTDHLTSVNVRAGRCAGEWLEGVEDMARWCHPRGQARVVMKESGLHREQRQLDATRPAGLVEDFER